jgi:uncharacterized membrane protein YfcA
MLSLRALLYVALGAGTAAFVVIWGRLLRSARTADEERARPGRPSAFETGVGFLTDFLDTLGIGSFAVTTALYRLTRLVPDHLIPGTLLIGHALPTVAQSFIYITIVEVETLSLVLLVAASIVGAWFCAGVVAGLPRRRVQVAMGTALLIASTIMIARRLGWFPQGGDALGLSGWKLAAGMAGNLVLGALMTIGIGAYAPSLILFALLGMNVKSIFPIMMSSCAFIMLVAGLRFVPRGSYAARPALGLALGGVPAVLIAASIVRELPLAVLSWIVVVVVVYTGVTMLLSARRGDAPSAG